MNRKSQIKTTMRYIFIHHIAHILKNKNPMLMRGYEKDHSLHFLQNDKL